MKTRLYYFDNVKYFLIISVILGHLLQNNGLSDKVAVGLFDTIFMFAMPVFVFISGIFTSPREHSLNVKFWLSELGLVETMIVSSLIMKLPFLFWGVWQSMSSWCLGIHYGIFSHYFGGDYPCIYYRA